MLLTACFWAHPTEWVSLGKTNHRLGGGFFVMLG